MAKSYNLAIFLFEDVELLDFTGPYEVFSCAETNFKVFTLGTNPTITTKNGLKVVSDYLITQDFPDIDILLIPGGKGARDAIQDERVLSWIRKMVPKTEYIVTVCTGALFLAAAKLVDNLAITTHFNAYEELRKLSPKSIVCTCRRFVDNGKILSSAGISAGIDLSLYLVKKLVGPEIAKSVKIRMEYDSEKYLAVENCKCSLLPK